MPTGVFVNETRHKDTKQQNLQNIQRLLLFGLLLSSVEATPPVRAMVRFGVIHKVDRNGYKVGSV